MKNYLVSCLFILFVLIFSSRTALAFEEEHEAHEHGHATLLVVQEKDELQLIFKSPAMNIVGFEHQASSAEQKAKIASAESILKDADKRVQINDDAKCTLEHAQVSSSLLDRSSQDEHHHDHSEHKETHSEFEADYHFECENLDGLKVIKFSLFDVFTTLVEIDAQLVTQSGQRLEVLKPNHASIRF